MITNRCHRPVSTTESERYCVINVWIERRFLPAVLVCLYVHIHVSHFLLSLVHDIDLLLSPSEHDKERAILCYQHVDRETVPTSHSGMTATSSISCVVKSHECNHLLYRRP